ncbi:MAG: ATP synthase F1 subunit epsilon [Verrucomicrobiales bacterium]|jgi:F-type H+-transporting ATPase subunit epsilon|nr:ATP synthase F1 subunit epsilon [Verrucomicrobiales bacterium]
MKLQLEIVTPEKKAFSGEVDSVVVPTVEGDLGILPGHTPVMTLLQPGHLQVINGEKKDYLAIGSGFAEIAAHKVVVLTDAALSEDQIDEVSVEAAIERAQKALQEKVSPEEEAALKAGIQKSLAQLHLKRRKHQP